MDDKQNTPMTEYLRELAGAAEMDQNKAAFTTLATVMRHYYAELKDAGFTPMQAMTLTAAAQASLLSNAGNQKGGQS